MKTFVSFSFRSLLWLMLFPMLMLSQRASAEQAFAVESSGTGWVSWYYDEDSPALIEGENLTQIGVCIDPCNKLGYPFDIYWGDGDLLYSCGQVLVDANGEETYSDEGFIPGYTPDDEITCWISGPEATQSEGYAYLTICSRTNAWYGRSLFVSFQERQMLYCNVLKGEINNYQWNCNVSNQPYFKVLPFGDFNLFEDMSSSYGDDYYAGYFDSYNYEGASNQYNMQRIQREQPIAIDNNMVYFFMDPHFEVSITNGAGETVSFGNYSAPHGMSSYLTVVQQQVLH